MSGRCLLWCYIIAAKKLYGSVVSVHFTPLKLIEQGRACYQHVQGKRKHNLILYSSLDSRLKYVTSNLMVTSSQSYFKDFWNQFQSESSLIIKSTPVSTSMGQLKGVLFEKPWDSWYFFIATISIQVRTQSKDMMDIALCSEINKHQLSEKHHCFIV